MKAVLPAIARALLAPQLPDDMDVAWFTDVDSAKAGIADAEIAWVDMDPSALTRDVVRASGPGLKWLSTLYAGLDVFPLDMLRARGVRVTNGAGVNAVAVAEYAVLGVLACAKRYDEVVRAADRQEWLRHAPGRVELFDTRALVIGAGAIGRLIVERLAAFGVGVTAVTRSGRDGTLTPDGWRARLGEFDWVILAAPATDATRAMIGVDELAAMKPGAHLVNIARGSLIDQDALVMALKAGQLAGAFLDPTTPEPLPPDHPLWSAPNLLLSMHLSGRSTTRMFERAGALFLANLAAYRGRRPMRNVVDLGAGY